MPSKKPSSRRGLTSGHNTNLPKLPERFAIAGSEIRPEQFYVIKDRHPAGRGPWADEPVDKLAWRDVATGLDCILLRQTSGVWAGFVGVEPGHPLHGFHADAIPAGAGLSAHGGIDFAEACSRQGPQAIQICHVRHSDRVLPTGQVAQRDDAWWFGFAADKPGDLVPSGSKPPLPREEGEVYRDLDYMYSETIELARQLKEIDNGPSITSDPLLGSAAPKLGRS